MAGVFLLSIFPACFFFNIKGTVCAIIVHSRTEAASVTVLTKKYESWP